MVGVGAEVIEYAYDATVVYHNTGKGPSSLRVPISHFERVSPSSAVPASVDGIVDNGQCLADTNEVLMGVYVLQAGHAEKLEEKEIDFSSISASVSNFFPARLHTSSEGVPAPFMATVVEAYLLECDKGDEASMVADVSALVSALTPTLPDVMLDEAGQLDNGRVTILNIDLTRSNPYTSLYLAFVTSPPYVGNPPLAH
mmetsp:Transcript_9477/g.25716  ORF Transcript_9477/g.25716 Transcript_9477/m.25716 type:complete len:199 (-) Transcript_9477:39-635(-)